MGHKDTLEIIASKDIGNGFLVIYKIRDNFSKNIKYIEFCFAPKLIYWDHVKHNTWLNLMNSIISTLLKDQLGKRNNWCAEGARTEIEMNLLTRRIREPGNLLLDAENIFNNKNRYVHGKVEIINNISSNYGGFINLDVRFILYKDLGKASFKISL